MLSRTTSWPRTSSELRSSTRPSHLFLGRKGSGKSALFRQLPQLSADAGGPAMLDITPDDYSWSALKSYREQGLGSEQAHTNAWTFTLAVELASHLIALE